jgi:hypothetical protein
VKRKDNLVFTYGPPPRPSQDPRRQFDKFEASTLFCGRCKRPVPVRKKLLLALPDGDKYDYLCVHCGNSVGTKTEQSEIPIQVILK